MNPIKNFLHQKATPQFSQDEDKFFDFPIQIVNKDGFLSTYFIQDAVISANDENYSLELILIDGTSAEFRALHAKTSCIAPAGCQIDWDNVKCSFELSFVDQDISDAKADLLNSLTKPITDF